MKKRGLAKGGLSAGRLSRALAAALALLCCASVAWAASLTPQIYPNAVGETQFSFDQSQGETPGTQAEPGAAEEIPWTYPISREILADPLDVLILANKEHRLAETYPPEDALHALVDLTVPKTSSDRMQGRALGNEALEAMFAAAEAEGVKLYVKSAYRSYRTQATMHYNRVKRLGRDDGVVQAEGASDHQTGLGFDVVSWAWRDQSLNERFAQTAEGQWMAENCARFGFVVRYPQGKTDVTGIMYEPWHLRYVGAEVALYMTEQGLTLEEFTAQWQAALEAYEAGESGVETDAGSFTF